MGIQNILTATTADNKFKQYNEQIIPILDTLKSEDIIDDYRVIKDGGSEFVSVIEILDEKPTKDRPGGWGKKKGELYELGYRLGITDEELSYATSSSFGLREVTKRIWDSSDLLQQFKDS